MTIIAAASAERAKGTEEKKAWVRIAKRLEHAAVAYTALLIVISDTINASVQGILC